jgi:hypothetical protein
MCKHTPLTEKWGNGVSPDLVVVERVGKTGHCDVHMIVAGKNLLRGVDSGKGLVSVDLMNFEGSELPREAFRDCRLLERVVGSSHIRRIGRLCFYFCGALAVCDLPGMEEIEDKAFYSAGLGGGMFPHSFVFPLNLRRIGRHAFACMKLREIDLRATKLGFIEIGGFWDSSALRVVRLGMNVGIESAAFGDTPLLACFEIGDSGWLHSDALRERRSVLSITCFSLRGMRHEKKIVAVNGRLASGGFVRGEGLALMRSTVPLGALVG